MVPNKDPLNLGFNVWDIGQDIAATADVLGEQTWECELGFSVNVGVTIIGETDHVISTPGSNAGVFAITKFEGSGTSIQFEAECTSPETGRYFTSVTSDNIIQILSVLYLVKATALFCSLAQMMILLVC